MSRALGKSSLAVRLAAGLFLPLLLAVAAVIVVWGGFDRARAQLSDTHSHVLPAFKTVYGVRQSLSVAGELQQHWLAAPTREERGVLAAQWSAHGGALQRRIHRYEALDPEDGRLAHQFALALQSALDAQGRVMADIEPGQSHEQAIATAQKTTAAALEQAEAWRLHVEQWADDRASAASQALSLRDVLAAALVMAALAVALVQWQRLHGDLAKPLLQSANALKALSKGRFDFALPLSPVPEMHRLVDRIDSLREVVAFACEGDDEPDEWLTTDADRLAITARALARYRHANIAVAPLMAHEGGAHEALNRAANDALAQPA